eukprot:232810-Chlamydomonas_euryale.AAC.6
MGLRVEGSRSWGLTGPDLDTMSIACIPLACRRSWRLPRDASRTPHASMRDTCPGWPELRAGGPVWSQLRAASRVTRQMVPPALSSGQPRH